MLEISKQFVLLVDDEALIRLGTAASLEELGHQVMEAGSGEQALQMLQDNEDIDVIVTDYQMGGMTGAELIQRAQADKPGIKAVLMTGFSSRAEGISGVSYSCLMKPFGLRELSRAIAEA